MMARKWAVGDICRIVYDDGSTHMSGDWLVVRIVDYLDGSGRRTALGEYILKDDDAPVAHLGVAPSYSFNCELRRVEHEQVPADVWVALAAKRLGDGID